MALFGTGTSSRQNRSTKSYEVHIVTFIAVSRAMRKVLAYCDAVTEFPAPVLVVGETGTGKELVCRRIHDHGPCRRKSFVAVNCAAVPDELFEREFFGHVRGAFTGAMNESPGYIEHAAGGTLFLDEVGELPLNAQPKLLRVLEAGVFRRVGEVAERQVSFRLIAATNQDLRRMVRDCRFRADLYYRLQGLTIRIPPLRERRQDIVPLLEHFLAEVAGCRCDLDDYMTTTEREVLMRQHMAGNVRELITLARTLCMRKKLDRGKLVFELPMLDEICAGSGTAARPQATELLNLLNEHDGNKKKLAQYLGISRTTLYRWLSVADDGLES